MTTPELVNMILQSKSKFSQNKGYITWPFHHQHIVIHDKQTVIYKIEEENVILIDLYFMLQLKYVSLFISYRLILNTLKV